MSPSSTKITKKIEQIDEILTNQNFILDAIQNLNKRLETIEVKYNDTKLSELNDVIETQALIDEIVVKTSDDISKMKKVREENGNSIKVLESKIDILDKEIKTKIEETKQREQVRVHAHKVTESEKRSEKQNIICRYHNKGFCREKTLCTFKHSESVCEIFLKDGKCFNRNCSSRHPNNCKYEKQGCFRGNMCAYKHIDSKERKANQIVIDDIVDIEKENEDVEETMTIDKTNEDYAISMENEINVASFKCGKCGIEKAKNECKHCGKYLCSECEVEVHGKSVLEFMNENNFLNYTCSTVHY